MGENGEVFSCDSVSPTCLIMGQNPRGAGLKEPSFYSPRSPTGRGWARTETLHPGPVPFLSSLCCLSLGGAQASAVTHHTLVNSSASKGHVSVGGGGRTIPGSVGPSALAPPPRGLLSEGYSLLSASIKLPHSWEWLPDWSVMLTLKMSSPMKENTSMWHVYLACVALWLDRRRRQEVTSSFRSSSGSCLQGQSSQSWLEAGGAPCTGSEQTPRIVGRRDLGCGWGSSSPTNPFPGKDSLPGSIPDGLCPGSACIPPRNQELTTSLRATTLNFGNLGHFCLDRA